MYSSWWPAILQRIEKTSNENYVWTLLFLFLLWPVVLSVHDVSKKYSELTKIGSTSSRWEGDLVPLNPPVETALAWYSWYGKTTKIRSQIQKSLFLISSLHSRNTSRKYCNFSQKLWHHKQRFAISFAIHSFTPTLLKILLFKPQSSSRSICELIGLVTFSHQPLLSSSENFIIFICNKISCIKLRILLL